MRQLSSSDGARVPAKHLITKSLTTLEDKGLIKTRGSGAGLRIQARWSAAQHSRRNTLGATLTCHRSQCVCLYIMAIAGGQG